MLNPECVDKTEDGNAKIIFSDSGGDIVLEVFIDKNDIMQLAKMIQDNFSYRAKGK